MPMLSYDLKKLLKETSAGVLELGGARMALLDVAAGFWGIRRQMSALIGERLTNLVLQQAGANGGASFAKSIQGQFTKKAAAFSACVQAYQVAGFGQFEIVSMEWPLGRIKIQAREGIEAWMFHQHGDKSEGAVCAYSAGVFVGFVNVIGGRQDVVCIEHSCQAKGDGVCTFELLPAEEMKDQVIVPYIPDPGLGRQINLLEMLFDRMPMGIAVLDRNYRIQRYNPTWTDFSKRYAPPNGVPLAPGVCYFDHLPGSEASILPMFERTLAGETIQQSEVRLESGGIVTYWDVVLAPLVEEKEIVGLLAVSTDATERVMLQQNLEARVEERTQEIERRQVVAESLREIIGMINSNISIEELLDKAVGMATERLGAAACTLHRIDLEKKEVTHVASYGLEKIYEKGAVRNFRYLKASGADKYIEATSQRQPTYTNYPPFPERVDEIRRDTTIPQAIKKERIALRERFAGSFSAPLFIQECLFGGLVFYYAEPQEFSSEQIQLGLTFAEQVAVAIDNARLRQEERERRLESERRRRVAESLQDIVAILNSGKSLGETLDFIVMKASQVLESKACILHHINEERNFVSIEASYGLPEALFGIKGFPLYSSHRSDNSILRGEPVWTADFTKRPRLSEETLATLPPDVRTWREVTGRTYRAWIAVPLIVEKEVYGSLAFYFANPKDFDEEEIQISQSIADQAAVAIENARLYQAEQDRQRELQLLLEVASTANSSLDMDQMLAQTLDLLVDSVEASRTGVILVDETSGEWLPHTIRPPRDVKSGDLAEMIQACQVVVDRGESLYVAPDPENGLIEPGALLPLQIRGRILGVLAIIGPQGSSFTTGQLVLFKSIADQIGVAIENARLFEKAEEAAIAAERNRLARDLHDAVTQTLFSASLIADVLPKIWEKKPVEGRKRLEELRQLTRGALSEMRTLLLELRPAALADTDLADLIGHQVNAFGARTRLPVTYQRNCEVNPPPEVKEMFYRITQEAFNNIAKHADAGQVNVVLECHAEQVELVIQDDGNGFELDLGMKEGLGLGIMQERARNVGAQLEIYSQIHAGTRLCILWQKPNDKEFKDA